jgi:hypothetical protein
MSRKLLLWILAALAITPALAQVTPIRIIQPIRPSPVIAPPAMATVPQINPVFDVSNDPERAKALITKLRKDKRQMRNQLQGTLAELQEARRVIDEMTKLGGSMVLAQCASATLSRTTSGVEENCAATGYTCAGPSGTCHRQCTSSSQCAPGFLCDTGVSRCVAPPPPANDDDDGWWPW